MWLSLCLACEVRLSRLSCVCASEAPPGPNTALTLRRLRPSDSKQVAHFHCSDRSVYLLTKIHAKDTRRYTRFLHKAKIHFRSSPKCRFHGLRITAEVKPSLPPSSGEGNGMMEEGRDGDGPGRVEWPCGAGVTLSEESGTGFLNVLKQPGGRKKPFYV
eukprot:2516435-Prymnesium_polylepis.1